MARGKRIRFRVSRFRVQAPQCTANRPVAAHADGCARRAWKCCRSQCPHPNRNQVASRTHVTQRQRTRSPGSHPTCEPQTLSATECHAPARPINPLAPRQPPAMSTHANTPQDTTPQRRSTAHHPAPQRVEPQRGRAKSVKHLRVTAVATADRAAPAVPPSPRSTLTRASTSRDPRTSTSRFASNVRSGGVTCCHETPCRANSTSFIRRYINDI